MMSRRRFLASSLLLPAGGLLGRAAFAADSGQGAWFMPDEGETHARTWMAFGPSVAIWGRKLLPETRRNLALLANVIAQYEPVSLLVRENELEIARSMVSDKVELVVSPLDDLWIRDTGPTFVLNPQGGKAAVNFNFNGWGGKQTHRQDAKVAAFVAKQAGVEVLPAKLVMEGGCIEVDGHGTAIMTESCVLNDNRNPGVSKAQFEDLLMPLLGLDKIIWLPGVKGKDITDGHTDFYARFARPGVVLAGYDPDPDSYDHDITLRHLEILKSATDAQGGRLEVISLEGPMEIRKKFLNDEFAAGYIGFYVCNGAVIMQEFGDQQADKAARDAIQQAFPGRKIEQLNVDGIAAGGGSIHCATQQEPQALA
ncbi:agmatine deiminase family protein [Candidatus Thiothrix sp. Deng01]|uniref:Agmatine deiminase family protein n=1 Tax=Candidatus Thiothrix phosphatis TaxID=3112415 RepID=A0ABU6D0R0_9GAMM|nr:agmatine deiminase family protein [Candidatus Thiothrix sp. Deng01]MEB4592238.1 agmatine deiminase family protein [Candidatus Thiothrix sp. Deng01]